MGFELAVSALNGLEQAALSHSPDCLRVVLKRQSPNQGDFLDY